MAIISGSNTITKSLFLITAGGDTGTEEKVLMDSTSLISASHSTSVSTGSIATDSTGVKFTGTWEYTMPQKITLASDVLVYIQWEVVTASAGSPEANINIDIQKNGSTISATKAVSVTARDISAAAETQYQDLMRIEIPETTWNRGDTLDVVVEFDVTTASGSGSSTGTYKFLTDPNTASEQCIVEINV